MKNIKEWIEMIGLGIVVSIFSILCAAFWIVVWLACTAFPVIAILWAIKVLFLK